MGEQGADFRIEVCGQNLRARWLAPQRMPGQPVIVLLHQGLGSLTQWRNFPAMLAAATGCAILAYDRLGYGKSQRVAGARPADFLAIEAEQVLPAILDHLGLDKVIVHGHSDGGTIALLFAAAHPKRATAVICEDGHVFAEAHVSTGFADMIKAFETGDLRQRLARHHDHVDSMFRSWTAAWLGPEMRDWRMTDRLPLIRCPVLAMQGENDDHCLPEQLELIAAGVGGEVEKWVVPACGHAPHLEATEAVVQRIATFLRRNSCLSGA